MKSPNLRDFQGLRVNEYIRAGELDGAHVQMEQYLRGGGTRDAGRSSLVFCPKPLYINVKNMPRRSQGCRGRLGVEKRAANARNTKQ